MIKFFRKIRQKLLSENKFSKYLIYAIGEIVLVVIGILIAIRLNSWNNQKTLFSENEKLLVSLIKDLQNDVNRFHSIAEVDEVLGMSLRTAIVNSERQMKLSYLKLNAQLADSLLSIPPHSGLHVVNAETSVYDQLKSTGRLYSIGSDTLRSRIIDYYSMIASDAAYIDRYNSLMMNWLFKLDFVRTIRVDKENDPKFDLNNYPWLFDSRSSEMQTFRDVVDRLDNFQRRSYVKFTGLRDRASELIKQIKKELPMAALETSQD